MRCGRISVQGEAEDIIDVPAKPRLMKKRHDGIKSSFNPYSALGLDKFATLNAELSANRQYVARKTGNPEATVRFVYTHKGWVPVVVKNGGVSILPRIRTKQGNQSKVNYNSNQKDEAGIHGVKADEGCQNGVNGSAIGQETVPVIMPWWFGCLRTTAFGVLTVSVVLVRKSVAAMAVVMVVGSLQCLWLGGVMCMKRFIDTGISYFSELLLHWKRSQETRSSPNHGALHVQPPMASPEHKMTISKKVGPMHCLSAPCSPTVRGQATAIYSPKNNSSSQELNTQLQGMKKNKKKKKFGRIVSMDGQPRKPIRLQQSDSFVSRRGADTGEIDATLGATVMIILLFFLVFYGRLCAICFTSTWWYALPNLRTESSNSSSSYNNNSRVVMDLQSKNYKKKVIMDGLLHRNHGRAN